MKHKKTLKLLFGGLGAALLLSLGSFMTTFAADHVTTMATTAPLNLRSGVGTDTSVITVIPEGTSVEVFSMTYDGWYNVKYNNQEGYAYYVYLNFEGDEDGAVHDGKVTTMYATAPLNIRQQPNTNAKIVGTLAYDEGVEVYSKHDGWFSVKHNGVEGYCHGAYLNFGQADKVVETESEQAVASNTMNDFVTTAPLNVRTAPSTTASIIGSFKVGDTVKVIGTEGDWCKVEFNGTTGYSHGDWIQ